MKAKMFFCFVVLALAGVVALPAFAQSQFVKTLGGGGGDYGYSVIKASDGGFVVTGRTGSFGVGGEDLLLAKFDASGNHLWTKTLGGGGSDYGYSVIQASDKGFVVTGQTGSFGAGRYDLLLAKFDSLGNHLWTKTLGGDSLDYGYSVIQVSDGGFVLTGHTESFGAGEWDLLLAKFDSLGNHLWTKTLGGDSLDYGYSVIQVSDGGFVLTGHIESFGAGEHDLLLAKFDASGNWLWTRTQGGTDSDYGRSVAVVSDGRLVVTGYTRSYGAGGDDLLLVKFDADGNTCMGEFVTPTVTSPSPTITNPNPTVSSPSPTVTSPTPTITSPNPTLTTVCRDPEFIRGDGNASGAVELGDIVHSWRVLFDTSYWDYGIVDCADAFDANDDGWYDVSDPNHLSHVMYDPSYPYYYTYFPPYPDCGLDPTPDVMGCDSFPPCDWPKSTAGQSNVAPSAVMKQDSQDTFKVAQAVGFPGQDSVVVPVLFSSDTTSMGFSIAVEYDNSILKVENVTTAGAYYSAGYSGMPFWNNSQGWLTLGVMAIGGGYIPPKTDDSLAYLTLSVDSNAIWPDTAELELKDGLGGGWPIDNVLTVVGFSHHPQKIPGRFIIYGLGDATQDGVLDTTDAIFGLNWLYGDTLQPEPPIPQSVDANQDGYWDVSDMVRIIYLSGGGKKPQGASKDNSTRGPTSSSKPSVADAPQGENLKGEVEGKLKVNPKTLNSDGYGQLKVVPINKCKAGGTLYVALVIYTVDDSIEAVGIGYKRKIYEEVVDTGLIYPNFLTPIDTTFYGVARSADRKAWSYNNNWSNGLGLCKLGILCSVSGQSNKFFPPADTQTMAQIAFRVSGDYEDTDFKIVMPDSAAVFSVHHGSPHHLPGDSGYAVGIPGEERPTLPKEFALQQNYPNPFNPVTQIRYELPVDGSVRLEIYNILGQRVATLVDGKQTAGYKTVRWDAQDLASGIYFYRLKAGEFTAIRKMVLLK